MSSTSVIDDHPVVYRLEVAREYARPKAASKQTASSRSRPDLGLQCGEQGPVSMGLVMLWKQCVWLVDTVPV